jgi:hypothetical protein
MRVPGERGEGRQTQAVGTEREEDNGPIRKKREQARERLMKERRWRKKSELTSWTQVERKRFSEKTPSCCLAFLAFLLRHALSSLSIAAPEHAWIKGRPPLAYRNSAMLPRTSGASKKAKRNDVDGDLMKFKASSSSSSSSPASTAALSLLESSGDERALAELVAECRRSVDDG